MLVLVFVRFFFGAGFIWKSRVGFLAVFAAVDDDDAKF